MFLKYLRFSICVIATLTIMSSDKRQSGHFTEYCQLLTNRWTSAGGVGGVWGVGELEGVGGQKGVGGYEGVGGLEGVGGQEGVGELEGVGGQEGVGGLEGVGG